MSGQTNTLPPQAEQRAPDPASRDTIIAIATPPGRGGIGILRLSGPQSLEFATPLLRLRAPLEPNRARFCEIIDPASEHSSASRYTHKTSGEPSPAPATKLDEAIATFYAAPHSYTGEDVVEIAAHGSPVLLDFLLRHILTLGARLAEPGEFTQRAFLDGRIDLTQAEAVRDLIEAQTLYQARIAAQQLDGALSRRIRPIKDALIHLIATMEAGIDFAEDDTPTLTPQQFVTAAEPIAAQLATLAHSFEHGRLVHSGLTLAIVGAPNVGKSSLFNRLVERERAIVTAVPGTTRDLVTERISLGGLPIELVDTAGLRDATDEAERLGIEKSREALAEADLVLLVLDAPEALAAEDPNEAETTIQPALGNAGQTASANLLSALTNRPSIVVLNKCDLVSAAHLAAFEAAYQAPVPLHSQVHANQDSACEGEPKPAIPSPDTKPITSLARLTARLPHLSLILTSASTGEGIPSLREAMLTQLRAPTNTGQDGMLTNLRQHQSVQAAQTSLQASLQASAQRFPDEMLLLDLYAALHSLDSLTGQTTPGDILNLIFSTFCIGK